uniref:Protein FAM114A2 n=1 Tax=Rhabditophanes sp. KR3021 TaxID=114890 RepID=A0AC35TQC4_9BILA
MSDSEDEFLSASEGEDEKCLQLPAPNVTNIAKKDGCDVVDKNDQLGTTLTDLAHNEVLAKAEITKSNDHEVKDQNLSSHVSEMKNGFVGAEQTVQQSVDTISQVRKVNTNDSTTKDTVKVGETLMDTNTSQNSHAKKMPSKKVKSATKKTSEWDCDWESILPLSSTAKKELPVVDDTKISSPSQKKEIKSNVVKKTASTQKKDIETTTEVCKEISKLNTKEIVNEIVTDQQISREVNIAKESAVEECTKNTPNSDKVAVRIKQANEVAKNVSKESSDQISNGVSTDRDSMDSIDKEWERTPSEHTARKDSSASRSTTASIEKIEHLVSRDGDDWFNEVEEELKGNNKPTIKPQSTSLWGWSGLTNVANVVSAVGDGISNAVETTLGIPSAEEMARTVRAREKISIIDEKPESSKEVGPANPLIHLASKNESSAAGHFSGLFSGLVNTSLDALEVLGKKTFDTLTVSEQKGEHSVRKFRFEGDKGGNLSDALKELRQKEQESESSFKPLQGYGTTVESSLIVSFPKIFEEHGGLVNLEGLENIANHRGLHEEQATGGTNKFSKLLDAFHTKDMKVIDSAEFNKALKDTISKIKVTFNVDPFISASNEQQEILNESQELDVASVDAIFLNAITSIAIISAKSVHAFHKIGQQLLLVPSLPLEESFFKLGQLFCGRIIYFAEEYVSLCSALGNSPKIEEMMTNLYYESDNSCNYVKKTMALLKVFYE